MKVPSWLSLVPVMLERFFYELDRHRAKLKKKDREGRQNEIKEDPTNSHADRFGPSDGRVSINDDDGQS